MNNNNMFTETKTTTTEKKSPSVFEEGGPVHPVTYGNIHDGISLRDYFAGQALGELLEDQMTRRADKSVVIQNTAKLAYRLADAMLEARTLKPQ
jgi:hypothetical protein